MSTMSSASQASCSCRGAARLHVRREPFGIRIERETVNGRSICGRIPSKLFERKIDYDELDFVKGVANSEDFSLNISG